MSDRQLSRAEQLAALPPELRAEVLGGPEEQAALEFSWEWWARPNQLPPASDWRTWLILAGRGFGKTRSLSEWIRAGMCGPTPLARGRWRHVALISETAADCRDVLAGDGKMPSDPSAGSGILQVHPKEFRPVYEPSKRRLTWPNGAAATLYNATEPEALRGPEHDAAGCDELCKWQYARETWDMLQFGLRGGANPQVMITTTPKPTALLKEIMSDPHTIVVRGSTMDNSSNLPPAFLDNLLKRYEGTRQGRQEIYAEILDDMPGALFKRSDIDACRVKVHQLPPLVRVVIAIDPAVSTNEGSDETGIVAAALGEDDHYYILDDVSGIYSPLEWAREAISLYRARRADRIVAEKNNGGDLIESTIRGVDPNVSYAPVWAARGKVRRAEPIASLYEQHRVHHCGAFSKLEDQLCSLTNDFDANEMGYSPDRADALVWALSYLVEGNEGAKFVIVH